VAGADQGPRAVGVHAVQDERLPERAAQLGCGIGLLGGQRLSLADYVAMPGPTDEATAAGGCSC
jgi:hypothetical protein